MANRDTPLIRNAWYVAAKGSEITREMMSRVILGKSIVLYRTENGEPIAMQNRCCHRSYPLSEGTLDGDTLVCGYHGFRYDCSGKCVGVPSQDKTPANIRLRSYPVVEQGPLVWIWPGDPALANESALPHQEFLDHPDWELRIGYLYVKGSYVHLHENLLDTSHLSFLHANTFGTPQHARVPVEENVEEAHFELWRHVEAELPPIYAKPLGWEGQKALRSSGSLFVSPGLHVNTGLLKNLEMPEGAPDSVATVTVAECITPETKTSFHYYFAQGRNFATGDDKMSTFMLESVEAAFKEDMVALEKINEMQDQDNDPDFYEIDVGADRPGVAMRRYLKKLADAEHIS